ncbi:Ig-like domain-containing protein [Vibrio sp. nBUS_14]|uniref:Ig-like domain-containing protein n=1 Tax=Vibrio sp. nBUS_14 TaxID=3395321 RepID=UPI003EB863C2
MKNKVISTFLLLVIFILNGCNSDYGLDSDSGSGSINSDYRLVVKEQKIPIDFEIPLTAELISNETGLSKDVTNEVSFKSSKESVIEIIDGNRAVALSPGRVDLESQIEYLGVNYSAFTALTAEDSIIQSIVINSGKSSFSIGEVGSYNATATFSDNSTLDITQQNNSIWKSSDPYVVSIDEITGEFTTISAGTAEISLSGKANGIDFSATDTLTVTNAVVTRIAITPQNSFMNGGETKQYTAMAIYSDNNTSDITKLVTWNIDNPSIATIDINGLLTAGITQSGQAKISASYSSIDTSFSDDAYVVVDNNVSNINSFGIFVDPVLPIFSNYKITATAIYDDGSNYDVSNDTNWSIDDTSLASIDDSGLLTIYGETGTLEITATYNEQTAKEIITIVSSPIEYISISPRDISLSNGLTEKLQAFLIFESGESLDVSSYSSINWLSNDPLIASVDKAGLVTAESLGTTNITITGTFNGEVFDDTIAVNVNNAVINELIITPRNHVLSETQSLQLLGEVTLSNSKTVDVTRSEEISWTSDDPSIAEITSSGIVKGNSPGQTIIRANYNGYTDSVYLSVIGLSSSDIVTLDIVSDQSSTLPVGIDAKFYLMATSSTGVESKIYSSPSFSWVSGDTNIATIDANTGVLTTKQAGTVEISITGDLSGVTPSSNYTLEVTPSEITAIKIKEGNVQTRVGVPIQFTVEAEFSDGNKMDTDKVSFISTDPNIGIVDNAGIFTPKSVGYTTIKATDNIRYLSDEVIVEVKPASLKSIDVKFKSGNTTLQAGTIEQVVVIGTWEDDHTAEITTFTDLLTSDKSIATIDPYGNLTTYKAGKLDITASIDDKFQDTISVDVVSDVISLSISNKSEVLPWLGTLQLIVLNQDGIDITKLSKFESDNESIMTVSDTGLVTNISVGQANITVTSDTASDSATFNTCNDFGNECLDFVNMGEHVLITGTPSVAYLNSISPSPTFSSTLNVRGDDYYTFDWDKANNICNSYNTYFVGGRNNWRLPSLDELTQLYDKFGDLESRNWPTRGGYGWWTSTSGTNTDFYSRIDLNSGFAYADGKSVAYFASCISE